jgi:uncharacterized membrane protein
MLARVLYWGGVGSAAVLVVGLLLLISAGGDSATLAEQLRRPTAIGVAPPGLGEILVAAAHGQATAVVMLGIVLLIATPVIRVIVSVIHFVRQRDQEFTTIGAIVLILLVIGFLVARSSAARSPRSGMERPAVRLTL